MISDSVISDFERELALSLRTLLRLQSGQTVEPINRNDYVPPLTEEEKSQLHLLKPSQIYPIGGDHDHDFRAHVREIWKELIRSRK